MKKHQSFLSPSILKLIELYDQAAAEVANQQSPSTQSVQHNQEPSHHSRGKGQKQSNPTILDGLVYKTVVSSLADPLNKYTDKMPSQQTTYTEVILKSNLSSIAEEDEQKQPVAREEQIPTTTAPLSRTRLALSEEQIIALLQHNRLIHDYQEEIQTLCQKVYGNQRALQKQLEQIKKDPSTGENLSTHIKEHPEGIHKFAGKKMLGIKSSARRHANNNFPTLCGLVDSYVAAVKITREDLVMTPEAALLYYEHSLGKETVNRILQSSHSSERSSPSLLNDDLSERAQQHPMVKRHHAQIQYWCKVVFGNSELLQQQTRELFENPALVEEHTWRLAEAPQSVSSYAGVGVGSLKNKARRHAEAGLSHLISAMGNYAHTVQRVREELTQTQQLQTTQQHGEISQISQRQQEFSRSPKPLENLAATSREETAGPSRHVPEPAKDVRPRRTTSSKAMAFAS
ncbi:BID domain-containing T4SS effector [Bartonella pachyuromydis]|uniref:Uncharacterized protein n=1 Tax=Bartonella pachyuromydis TaxID=931097 RepID=A0ABP8VJH3_9HYPH